MDSALLAWARAVKQRQQGGGTAPRLPVLWLFTDAMRLPDPLPAIARLPRGLCGVVFRHDNAAGRVELALRVAKLCKMRRLALVVAGDARLAARIGAGCHLRGGRWPGSVRHPGLLTASAHDAVEVRRARRAGARIVFLSPAFATVSHPEQQALGPVRWANIARRGGGGKIYCLGGVSAGNAVLLPRICAGAGAISALASEVHRTVT